jgi:hypothetical protein
MKIGTVSTVVCSMSVVALGCQENDANKSQRKPGAIANNGEANNGGGGGAGGAGGEGVRQPRRFLTDSDLVKPSGIEPTSEWDLAGRVLNEAQIYLNFPEDDSTSTSESWTLQDSCWSKSKANLVANASSYSLEMDVNLKDCLNNDKFGEAQILNMALSEDAVYVPGSLKLVSHRIRSAGQMSCTPSGATTFAGLNGLHIIKDEKSISKITDSVTCMGQAVEWHQTKVEGEFSFDYTSGGQTRTFQWINRKVFAGFGKALGEPCQTKWTGNQGVMEDCSSVDLYSSSHRDAVKNAFSAAAPELDGYHSIIRFLKQPTEQNSKGPWYPSGTQKLTFNEWSGTITYTGSNTAPTINMSNGMSTVATRLPYGPGANLLGQAGASRSSFLMKALSRAMGKAPSRD